MKLVFILSGTDAESPSTASSTSEHDRNLGQRIFRLGSAGQGKHPLKYASEIVQTTLLGFGGGGGGSGSDLPQRTSSDVREGRGGREGGRDGGEGKGGEGGREGARPAYCNQVPNRVNIL